MTYPAISRKDAQTVANQVVAAINDGLDPVLAAPEKDCELIATRKGCEYDRTAVESFAVSARGELLPGISNQDLTSLEQKEQSALEANMASRTHACLSTLEVPCLQDHDFWRYLALFPLRWYLIAREPELQPQDFGGLTTSDKPDGSISIQGTSMKLQLILRTYLWGKCSFDENDPKGGPGVHYRRATAIEGDDRPSSIDVWHSHMIRTQIGQMGRVPHAFIDLLAEPRKVSIHEARELAKLINRMKHNVMLDAHSYSSALDLVAGQLPDAKTLAQAAQEEKRNKKEKKK